MNPLKCANNSRQALYRVFVKPAHTVPSTFRVPAYPSLVQRATLSRKPNPNKHESLTTAERLSREDRGYDPRYQTMKDIERSGRSRLPKDHEITDPLVMVLEADVLEGPLNIHAVMKKILPHESLRMIKTYVPANKKENTKAEYAICQIVDKKEELNAQKKKDSAKKEKKLKIKELEMTWVISSHDLEVKMKNMRRFLEGGHKVQVQIGKKKYSKATISQEDAEEVVRKLKAEVETLGAREYRQSEGAVGERLTLHFAPKGVN